MTVVESNVYDELDYMEYMMTRTTPLVNEMKTSLGYDDETYIFDNEKSVDIQDDKQKGANVSYYILHDFL